MQEWAPELRVDEDLARRLIREQFPEVEQRAFRLLGEGWDNTVWLVDEEWVFRFPRRAMVVPGLETEIAYLPRLAPLLPLPVPVPTLVGQPTDAFGWPFCAAPFLPGRELAEAALDEEARLALGRPLGEFLLALHSVELDAELPVDPVRRADMAVRVPMARERFGQLERDGIWSVPPEAYEVVDAAAALPPPTRRVVVHGDLHLRHLLVGDSGEPTAVIDWIDLSANDPAVDLVLYRCALPPEGRAEFESAYGPVAEDQLLRACTLALFLCGTLAVYGHHEGLPDLTREAVGSLERIIRTG
ncbi:MAG TPA: phosphotransferase [Gaiellaceae bacterium]|nr:phosphotransferase [Gaiellaceae bacterium]